MAARPALDTVAKVAKASHVGNGTIQRIKTAEVACAIDTLHAIARAFELEAWQLMVPGIDPRNPPVLRQLSPEEAELYHRLQSILSIKGK